MSIFTQGHPIFIAETEAEVSTSGIAYPEYCFIYCIDTKKLLRYIGGVYTKVAVVNHEDLLLLQGGQAGQYYHLNAAEYGFRNTAATSIYQQTSAMSNYLTNIKVSAGSISSNISAIVFGNSNNVSFGMDSGTITATVNQSIQTQLIAGVYDGANSITSGTLVFSNSNGITFGINGQTITAAHNGITAPQSQQPMYYSASGSSSSSNTLQFGNTNGISFSISNGSIVGTVATNYQSQGAYLTTAAQSTQTLAFSLGGNSATTNSSQILNGGFVLAGGNGVTIAQSNNSISLSVATNYLTTAAQSSQTILFSLGGNSATTNSSRVSNGAYLLAGGNGVTLQQNNNSLSISVATNYQSQGAYLTTAAQSTQTLAFSLGGNSATTNSSQILNGGFVLAGGNGVTIAQSNNSISLSVATNYQSQGAYLTTAAQSSQTIAIGLAGNSATTNSSNITAGSYALAGGNGVTLAQSNNTISISVATNYQSQGAYLTTAAQSSQTLAFSLGGNSATTNSSQISNGGFVLAGGNGVTVQQSNNTISLSVRTDYQSTNANYLTSQSNQAGSAGNGSFTFQTISFSNANGISFSTSAGSAIVASHNGITSQTNQNISLFGLGNTTQNSSTVLNANAILFNAIGSLTVGYSNGSIQLSAPNAITSQTNQTIGLYALGNTTQNSSTTLDARTLSFNGLGAATVGYSNGSIQVSVPVQSAQTQSNIQALAAGGVTATTGTVVFSNSNGISFGLNGQTMTGSHNGITSQSNQNISLFAVGNTTQNSSTVLNANAISFNGLGNASLGFSNGSIQVSITAAGGGGITNINVSAGTTSNNLSALTFADSNGISFGLSGNSVVTATVKTDYQSSNANYLTSQSNQAFSAQGGSSSFQTLVFTNSNGISFSNTNGSIWASHNGITSQTAQTVGLYALGNTTQNSSTTLDARTLSFNGLGIVTVGYSNGSIQISATSAAQTNQNISFFALGNTTQNSSTVLNANAVSFNGLGAATVGYSNGSIQVSVPTQTVQTQNMVSVQGSTGNISFSNSNGITFGFNNSTITASHNGITSQSNQNISLFALGNTTQNSSTVLNANAISFNGIGAATVGYSNGSIQVSVPVQSAQTQSNIAGIFDGVNSISTGTVRFTNANGVSFSVNGQTVSASVSTQPTLSFWEPEAAAGMQANTIGNATLSFIRLNVPNRINATQMALIQHFSNSTGNVSGASITYYAAIYTMGGSTAGMLSSNSQSLSFNLNSTTNASSVYGGQSGTRFRTVGLGGTWNITPGEYLFAVGMRVSTQATSLSISQWCRPSVSINAIPGGGNFSQFFMHGVYSASTTGIPASIQLNEINATGSAAQRVPYFILAGTF